MTKTVKEWTSFPVVERYTINKRIYRVHDKLYFVDTLTQQQKKGTEDMIVEGHLVVSHIVNKGQDKEYFLKNNIPLKDVVKTPSS